MERPLLLALVLLTVLLGSAGAVLRPGLFRLGQEGTPAASSGVIYRGTYRNGRWLPARRGADWSRVQGRGPSGVK